MTNMPFEKNKKKKRFLDMLFPESECGKGVTCCGAEESPLPYFTLTFCAEITHTSAPQACEA